MTADVKPEKLLLVRKFLVIVPRCDRLPPRCCGSMRLLIEERNLSGHPIALESRRGCKRIFDTGEEFRAIPPGEIKRACLDEAFQHFAIGYARIEPAAEILQRRKLAAFVALANGPRHGCLTDIFDRGKAVTNCIQCGSSLSAATVGTLRYLPRFRCEFQSAFVDVRRKNRNPHPFAFTYEDRNFFRVIDFVAQQTRHEFERIMRLEEGRVVTDYAIGCAVTLIESVTGKFFEQIENSVRFFLRDFVCLCAALDEIPALFRHLLLVLLAHRAPEKVGL